MPCNCNWATYCTESAWHRGRECLTWWLCTYLCFEFVVTQNWLGYPANVVMGSSHRDSTQ